MRTVILFFAVLLSCSNIGGEQAQIVAAIHVHSRFSNGDLSIEELARLAEGRRVDLLVVTDSLLTKVSYGIWPLDRIGIPGLNTFARPSVLDHGMDRYLEEIRSAQASHPDLVILPGVEVAPSWHWEGSPWSGLALHGFDHHLIVFGLSGTDLVDLPVTGNERWTNTDLRWSRVSLPLATLAGGVALLWAGVLRSRVRGPTSKPPLRGIGVALLLAGSLVAWNNYPFGQISDPSSGRSDVAPDQTLIDWVAARGGVVYWSYPEAKAGRVTSGGATMVSTAHPEDLLDTQGYHGFEGLYGDEIKATAPGAIWDRALIEYLEGRRARAPFVVTGIDYHGPKKGGDGWDEIDGGRTMVLMEERSPEAALDALRDGHAYATFQAFPQKWRLDEFAVTTADGTSATHGERVSGPSPVTLSWKMGWIDETPEAPVSFRFDLIRNGEVIESFTSPLPIQGRIVQELPRGEYYFRAMADAHRLNRLVTNPVFVTVE